LLGLKPSSLIHDQQSFSVSTITAIYPVRTLGETLPYNQFDTVSISRDGVAILVGLVSSVEKVYSGQARSWKIVFSDPWYYLENCYALKGGWRPVYNLYASDNVIPKAKISDAIKGVLDTAKHHPATYELRINDDKLIIPWNASCDTIGSLLQSIRRWSPRMVSYYDYSGNQPKLIITDYDSLEPISMPLQPTDTVKSIDVSLSPRGDLVPPCVAIVADTSGSSGYNVSYLSRYPADGDPTLPHSIVYRVASDFYYSKYNSDGSAASEPVPVSSTRSGSLAYQRMKIRGRQINQSSMITSFWERHFPWMQELEAANQIIPYAAPSITGKAWDGASGEDEPKGYDTSATGFELVEGQIHTKALNPKWCKTTIKQRLCIPESAPAQWRDKFKNIGTIGTTTVYWQEFAVDLVTMDRAYSTYPIDGMYNGEQPSNEDDGGDEPADGVPYADIARAVWESMQELPYDGDIAFAARGGAQNWQYMGRRVSLTGGNPEWENINTLVQTVSHDLQTDVITLAYGAANQLGVEDLLELNQVNAISRQSSSLENMQGAPEPGDLTYDPKPESPTISQQITASTGSSEPAPEYGFQIRLEKDTSGAVTGASIKPGAIYLNGSFLGMYPAGAGSGSSWVKIPVTAGEVWLNLHFDQDAKLDTWDISGIPGPVYPIFLNTEKPNVAFDYAFHVADIDGDKVTQYALGMIQVPVFGGTFYPYGPS